ncbi:MAG: hypothetical protein ABR924_00570 [Terracidiphilus sp.]|jgi:hypothetical protein
MKNWLPVLVLFAGLGNSISSAPQNIQQKDPFSRYLAGIKSNQPESALVRFADECGVNINTARPHFAQLPGNEWKEVKSLSRALEDQETDFYGTVAVWLQTNLVLVERWGMDLESGNEARKLFCLKDQRILLAEEIDWALVDKKGSNRSVWLGYEQRWKMKPDGKYTTVLTHYVNRIEQPVPTPGPDSDVPYASYISPDVYNWDDLKLPDEFLK